MPVKYWLVQPLKDFNSFINNGNRSFHKHLDDAPTGIQVEQ